MQQYFRCLEVNKYSEGGFDLSEVDAHDWVLRAFKPLILPLIASSDPSVVERPTLAQYLSPQQCFVCTLAAVDDELQPKQLDTKEPGWVPPLVRVNSDFLAELDRSTRCFAPSGVQLCYDRPEDTLIKLPRRVIIKDHDGQHVDCFYRSFKYIYHRALAKKQINVLKKVIQAQIPPSPGTYICRLHGVVMEADRVVGMLFTWIDDKGVLSVAMAAKSSPELRQRWAAQNSRSLGTLHSNGVIWGVASAESVLIDEDDNAWITDFEGGLTMSGVGWYKPWTVEEDRQGLAEIIDILN
ncbi:unnamed protein product [Clonostachys byssicola]|uniref:Uncharacterized protein n=1 Tax=Clonostachys byssicola TaxID=160290 RepID=A0A9N9UKQ6_9HYPO|nr:unnamed protein product [Clonostachys byssicola]